MAREWASYWETLTSGKFKKIKRIIPRDIELHQKPQTNSMLLERIYLFFTNFPLFGFSQYNAISPATIDTMLTLPPSIDFFVSQSWRIITFNQSASEIMHLVIAFAASQANYLTHALFLC